MKTTCCFGENDVLFSMKGRERENTYPRNRNREHCIRIVKTSITPFSRAHAYTHITGVFAFLLSQVSQDYLQYAINQISTVCFRQILTNMGFKGGKHTDNGSQKSFLSLFRPPKIVWFFPQNFPLCDTCDSKKSTSLLEGARTRVRETGEYEEASFWQLHHAKQSPRKIFCHFFLDFSLFVGISTHIQIGRETKSKGRKRFIRHLEWWCWKKRKLPNILHIGITTNKCTVMNSSFLYQAWGLYQHNCLREDCPITPNIGWT